MICFSWVVECWSMINVKLGSGRRRCEPWTRGLLSENSCGGWLFGLDHQVPPGVGFGQNVGFYRGILKRSPSHFVLYHGFEVVLEGVQRLGVVYVDGAVAMGYDVAKVLEQGLSFINRLDFAFVKIRGHNSGWSWGRFTRWGRGSDHFDLAGQGRRRWNRSFAKFSWGCTKNIRVRRTRRPGPQRPRSSYILTGSVVAAAGMTTSVVGTLGKRRISHSRGGSPGGRCDVGRVITWGGTGATATYFSRRVSGVWPRVVTPSHWWAPGHGGPGGRTASVRAHDFTPHAIPTITSSATTISSCYVSSWHCYGQTASEASWGRLRVLSLVRLWVARTFGHLTRFAWPTIVVKDT